MDERVGRAGFDNAGEKLRAARPGDPADGDPAKGWPKDDLTGADVTRGDLATVYPPA